MNILQTTAYQLNDEKKVPVIKKLARKGGTAVNKTFTSSENETCKTAEGLFVMLSEIFRLQHDETISLQYCKLKRRSEDSTQEMMGRL